MARKAICVAPARPPGLSPGGRRGYSWLPQAPAVPPGYPPGAVLVRPLGGRPEPQASGGRRPGQAAAPGGRGAGLPRAGLPGRPPGATGCSTGSREAAAPPRGRPRPWVCWRPSPTARTTPAGRRWAGPSRARPPRPRLGLPSGPGSALSAELVAWLPGGWPWDRPRPATGPPPGGYRPLSSPSRGRPGHWPGWPGHQPPYARGMGGLVVRPPARTAGPEGRGCPPAEPAACRLRACATG